MKKITWFQRVRWDVLLVWGTIITVSIAFAYLVVAQIFIHFYHLLV